MWQTYRVICPTSLRCGPWAGSLSWIELQPLARDSATFRLDILSRQIMAIIGLIALGVFLVAQVCAHEYAGSVRQLPGCTGAQ